MARGSCKQLLHQPDVKFHAITKRMSYQIELTTYRFGDLKWCRLAWHRRGLVVHLVLELLQV